MSLVQKRLEQAPSFNWRQQATGPLPHRVNLHSIMQAEPGSRTRNSASEEGDDRIGRGKSRAKAYRTLAVAQFPPGRTGTAPV